jgi:CheY-like chemotaxis protein
LPISKGDAEENAESCSAAAGEGLSRETVPDVILLHMLLPKMTGPEALQALKSGPVTAGIAAVVFHRAVAKECGPPGENRRLCLAGEI